VLDDFSRKVDRLTRSLARLASSTESFCASSLRFGGLFFAIPRRSIRFERTKKTSRDPGYFIDCGQERAFVGLRRFVEAADFSHELKRSGTNLFACDWRIEIEKDFDIPAHSLRPQDLEKWVMLNV
jgi:hypothetical protein